MEKKIFNPIEFDYRISLKINELNNVENIEDLLYIKLSELNNKCCEKGYIKENSVKIISYSNGYLNPIIFVPFIEYRMKCIGSIFLPYVDDIYLVKVVSINKIGIMCKIYYNSDYNKTYSPINIIIAKHTQTVDISNLKKDDLIYIKILALRFNKNSEHIHTIGNIIDDTEIQKIKDLSLIINELVNINVNFNINDLQLSKYTNILKFILDKETISIKELFIYDFIKTNNIDNKLDYKKLYNKFLENYNIKSNNIDTNELDTDTNIYENLESETNETELYDKSSNIDEYDLDLNNSDEESDSYLENDENLEDSSSEESDEENDNDIDESHEKESIGIESIDSDLIEIDKKK